MFCCIMNSGKNKKIKSIPDYIKRRRGLSTNDFVTFRLY